MFTGINNMKKENRNTLYKRIIKDIIRWKTKKEYMISEKDFINYLKLHYYVLNKHEVDAEIRHKELVEELSKYDLDELKWNPNH